MTDASGRGPLRRLAARMQVRHPAIKADDRELQALRERVDKLEALVEGLQDALYRQAVHQDDRLDDLTRRTTPEELARALSADARRRGL